MPLRCFDPLANGNVHAFDLSPDDWRTLEAQNRHTRHLRMPCCSAQVTLRKSRRGTQFFAHRSVGTCTTAPETEAHLRLKQLAVEVARTHGWAAQTEVSGASPSGELWKADVLAHKSNHRVAVEIQWSHQTPGDTMLRQARYTASGVRGLWLMRHSGFPVSHALPAALIGGTAEVGFTALLQTGTGEQVLPMEQLLAAAFSKRLRFGLSLGIGARVVIAAGTMECWSCHAQTSIITEIAVEAGPNSYRFSVPDLDKHSDLFATIRHRLPQAFLKQIRRRFSQTQGRSYLSNGCTHCGAFIGEFYEHEAWLDQQTICEFVVILDEPWLKAIRAHDDYQEGWGVYP